MDLRTLEGAGTRTQARCPQCAASGPSLAGLTPHFISLRCADCGEVWMVRERRTSPRASIPDRGEGDEATAVTDS
jgi:hypothetical protein